MATDWGFWDSPEEEEGKKIPDDTRLNSLSDSSVHPYSQYQQLLEQGALPQGMGMPQTPALPEGAYQLDDEQRTLYNLPTVGKTPNTPYSDDLVRQYMESIQSGQPLDFSEAGTVSPDDKRWSMWDQEAKIFKEEKEYRESIFEQFQQDLDYAQKDIERVEELGPESAGNLRNLATTALRFLQTDDEGAKGYAQYIMNLFKDYEEFHTIFDAETNGQIKFSDVYEPPKGPDFWDRVGQFTGTLLSPLIALGQGGESVRKMFTDIRRGDWKSAAARMTRMGLNGVGELVDLASYVAMPVLGITKAVDVGMNKLGIEIPVIDQMTHVAGDLGSAITQPIEDAITKSGLISDKWGEYDINGDGHLDFFESVGIDKDWGKDWGWGWFNVGNVANFAGLVATDPISYAGIGVGFVAKRAARQLVEGVNALEKIGANGAGMQAMFRNLGDDSARAALKTQRADDIMAKIRNNQPLKGTLDDVDREVLDQLMRFSRDGARHSVQMKANKPLMDLFEQATKRQNTMVQRMSERIIERSGGGLFAVAPVMKRAGQSGMLRVKDFRIPATRALWQLVSKQGVSKNQWGWVQNTIPMFGQMGIRSDTLLDDVVTNFKSDAKDINIVRSAHPEDTVSYTQISNLVKSNKKNTSATVNRWIKLGFLEPAYLDDGTEAFTWTDDLAKQQEQLDGFVKGMEGLQPQIAKLKEGLHLEGPPNAGDLGLALREAGESSDWGLGFRTESEMIRHYPEDPNWLQQFNMKTFYNKAAVKKAEEFTEKFRVFHKASKSGDINLREEVKAITTMRKNSARHQKELFKNQFRHHYEGVLNAFWRSSGITDGDIARSRFEELWNVVRGADDSGKAMSAFKHEFADLGEDFWQQFHELQLNLNATLKQMDDMNKRIMGDLYSAMDIDRYTPRYFNSGLGDAFQRIISEKPNNAVFSHLQNEDFVREAMQKNPTIQRYMESFKGKNASQKRDEFLDGVANTLSDSFVRLRERADKTYKVTSDVNEDILAASEAELIRTIIGGEQTLKLRELMPQVYDIEEMNKLFTDVFTEAGKKAGLEQEFFITKFYNVDPVDIWARYGASYEDRYLLLDILEDFKQLKFYDMEIHVTPSEMAPMRQRYKSLSAASNQKPSRIFLNVSPAEEIMDNVAKVQAGIAKPVADIDRDVVHTGTHWIDKNTGEVLNRVDETTATIDVRLQNEMNFALSMRSYVKKLVSDKGEDVAWQTLIKQAKRFAENEASVGDVALTFKGKGYRKKRKYWENTLEDVKQAAKTDKDGNIIYRYGTTREFWDESVEGLSEEGIDILRKRIPLGMERSTKGLKEADAAKLKVNLARLADEGKIEKYPELDPAKLEAMGYESDSQGWRRIHAASIYQSEEAVIADRLRHIEGKTNALIRELEKVISTPPILRGERQWGYYVHHQDKRIRELVEKNSPLKWARAGDEGAATRQEATDALKRSPALRHFEEGEQIDLGKKLGPSIEGQKLEAEIVTRQRTRISLGRYLEEAELFRADRKAWEEQYWGVAAAPVEEATPMLTAMRAIHAAEDNIARLRIGIDHPVLGKDTAAGIARRAEIAEAEVILYKVRRAIQHVKKDSVQKHINWQHKEIPDVSWKGMIDSKSVLRPNFTNPELKKIWTTDWKGKKVTLSKSTSSDEMGRGGGGYDAYMFDKNAQWAGWSEPNLAHVANVIGRMKDEASKGELGLANPVYVAAREEAQQLIHYYDAWLAYRKWMVDQPEKILEHMKNALREAPRAKEYREVSQAMLDFEFKKNSVGNLARRIREGLELLSKASEGKNLKELLAGRLTPTKNVIFKEGVDAKKNPKSLVLTDGPLSEHFEADAFIIPTFRSIDEHGNVVVYNDDEVFDIFQNNPLDKDREVVASKVPKKHQEDFAEGRAFDELETYRKRAYEAEVELENIRSYANLRKRGVEADPPSNIRYFKGYQKLVDEAIANPDKTLKTIFTPYSKQLGQWRRAETKYRDSLQVLKGFHQVKDASIIETHPLVIKVRQTMDEIFRQVERGYYENIVLPSDPRDITVGNWWRTNWQAERINTFIRSELVRLVDRLESLGIQQADVLSDPLEKLPAPLSRPIQRRGQNGAFKLQLREWLDPVGGSSSKTVTDYDKDLGIMGRVTTGDTIESQYHLIEMNFDEIAEASSLYGLEDGVSIAVEGSPLQGHPMFEALEELGIVIDTAEGLSIKLQDVTLWEDFAKGLNEWRFAAGKDVYKGTVGSNVPAKVMEPYPSPTDPLSKTTKARGKGEKKEVERLFGSSKQRGEFKGGRPAGWVPSESMGATELVGPEALAAMLWNFEVWNRHLNSAMSQSTRYFEKGARRTRGLARFQAAKQSLKGVTGHTPAPRQRSAEVVAERAKERAGEIAGKKQLGKQRKEREVISLARKEAEIIAKLQRDIDEFNQLGDMMKLDKLDGDELVKNPLQASYTEEAIMEGLDSSNAAMRTMYQQATVKHENYLAGLDAEVLQVYKSTENVDIPEHLLGKLQIEAIHSGGQIGVDQLGLKIAHLHGLNTGGVAPQGYAVSAGARWSGKGEGLWAEKMNYVTDRHLLQNIYGLREVKMGKKWQKIYKEEAAKKLKGRRKKGKDFPPKPMNVGTDPILHDVLRGADKRIWSPWTHRTRINVQETDATIIFDWGKIGKEEIYDFQDFDQVMPLGEPKIRARNNRWYTSSDDHLNWTDEEIEDWADEFFPPPMRKKGEPLDPRGTRLADNYSEYIGSSGSRLTYGYARQHGKPVFVIRDGRTLTAHRGISKEQRGQLINPKFYDQRTLEERLQMVKDLQTFLRKHGVRKLNIAGNVTMSDEMAEEIEWIMERALHGNIHNGPAKQPIERQLSKYYYDPIERIKLPNEKNINIVRPRAVPEITEAQAEAAHAQADIMRQIMRKEEIELTEMQAKLNQQGATEQGLWNHQTEWNRKVVYTDHKGNAYTNERLPMIVEKWENVVADPERTLDFTSLEQKIEKMFRTTPNDDKQMWKNHEAIWRGPVSYTYNKMTLKPAPMGPSLTSLAQEVAERLGLPKNYYDSVLINKYYGKKGLGLHNDHEAVMRNFQGGSNSIGTLSIGKEAKLVITDIDKKPLLNVVLKNGDIYEMPEGEFQQLFKHGIEYSFDEPRYSFTFRRTQAADDPLMDTFRGKPVIRNSQGLQYKYPPKHGYKDAGIKALPDEPPPPRPQDDWHLLEEPPEPWEILDDIPTSGLKPINAVFADKEWGHLSNFAMSKFVAKGYEFESVEHAYQSLKRGHKNLDKHPVIEERVYEHPSWKKSGRKTKENRGSKPTATREELDELMEELIRHRYHADEKFQELLSKTKGREITHTGVDKVWETRFPAILKRVRDQLEGLEPVSIEEPAETVAKVSKRSEPVKPMEMDPTGIIMRDAPPSINMRMDFDAPSGTHIHGDFDSNTMDLIRSGERTSTMRRGNFRKNFHLLKAGDEIFFTRKGEPKVKARVTGKKDFGKKADITEDEYIQISETEGWTVEWLKENLKPDHRFYIRYEVIEPEKHVLTQRQADVLAKKGTVSPVEEAGKGTAKLQRFDEYDEELLGLADAIKRDEERIRASRIAKGETEELPELEPSAAIPPAPRPIKPAPTYGDLSKAELEAINTPATPPTPPAPAPRVTKPTPPRNIAPKQPANPTPPQRPTPPTGPAKPSWMYEGRERVQAGRPAVLEGRINVSEFDTGKGFNEQRWSYTLQLPREGVPRRIDGFTDAGEYRQFKSYGDLKQNLQEALSQQEGLNKEMLNRYSILQVGGEDGFMLVDKKMITYLNDTVESIKDGFIQNKMGNIMHNFNTSWAAYATVPLVGGFGFHARNHGGNWFLMAQAGFKNPKHIVDATKYQALNRAVHDHMIKNYITSWDQAVDELVGTTVKGNLKKSIAVTAEDARVMKQLHHNAVLEGAFFRDLQYDRMMFVDSRSVRGRTSKRFKKILAENPVVTTGQAVGKAIEDNARIALYLDGIYSQGLSPFQSAARVREFLFDYGDLTPLELQVKNNLSRFYTFMRKNTALQARLLASSPQQLLNKQRVVHQIVQGLIGDNEGWDRKPFLPEWLQEQGRLFGHGGKVAARFETPVTAALETAQRIGSIPALVPFVREVLPDWIGGEDSPTNTQDYYARRAKDVLQLLAGGTTSGITFIGETVTRKSMFTGGSLPQDPANHFIRFINTGIPVVNKVIAMFEKVGAMDWFEDKTGYDLDLSVIADHQAISQKMETDLSTKDRLIFRAMNLLAGVDVYFLDRDQQSRLIGKFNNDWNDVVEQLKEEGVSIPTMEELRNIGAYYEADAFLANQFYAVDPVRAAEKKLTKEARRVITEEYGIDLYEASKGELTEQEQWENIRETIQFMDMLINKNIGDGERLKLNDQQIINIALAHPSLGFGVSDLENFGIEAFRDNIWEKEQNEKESKEATELRLNLLAEQLKISPSYFAKARPRITEAERFFKDGLASGAALGEVWLEWIDNMSRRRKRELFGEETLEYWNTDKALTKADLEKVQRKIEEDVAVVTIASVITGTRLTYQDIMYFVLYGADRLTNSQRTALGLPLARKIPDREDPRNINQIGLDTLLNVGAIQSETGLALPSSLTPTG